MLIEYSLSNSVHRRLKPARCNLHVCNTYTYNILVPLEEVFFPTPAAVFSVSGKQNWGLFFSKSQNTSRVCVTVVTLDISWFYFRRGCDKEMVLSEGLLETIKVEGPTSSLSFYKLL